LGSIDFAGIRLLDLPLSVALDHQLARDPPVSGSLLQWSISATSYKRYSIALKVPKAHPRPHSYRQPFHALLFALPYNENGIFFRKQSTVAAGAALSSWRTQTSPQSALNQLSYALPVGWQWQSLWLSSSHNFRTEPIRSRESLSSQSLGKSSRHHRKLLRYGERKS